MAGRKLLLADDSITIQKVVNLTFADEGIEVVTVGDGDSAIERISEEFPDIVLADVNMPGLNGYQVCERIRTDERTKHIPVILLVGAFEQFDEGEAARVGASAHLTKPFQSIRQLVNQVTDLIELSRPAAAPELSGTSEPEPVAASEPQPVVEASRADPFHEPVASRLESFREDRLASIDHDHQPLTGPTDEQADAGMPPEGDDIDRLYRQSIGEEPMPADGEFPDLGVDDEMIETSYTAPQPAPDELDLPSATPGPDFSNTVYQKPAKTGSVTPERVTYETTELTADDLPETVQAVQPEPRDQTVRLDPTMVEAKMAEENRRYEQLIQPVPVPQTPIGEDTIRMDSRFDTRGSSTYEFDDTDLLDIPVGTEVVISSPAEAAERSGKQVVTLSPELIEMIAQRVVEKLAERH